MQALYSNIHIVIDELILSAYITVHVSYRMKVTPEHDEQYVLESVQQIYTFTGQYAL